MRGGEWQPSGECELEGHLPACRAWEEVSEEEIERVFLVGRQGDGLPVELHAGVHERE